MPCDTSTTEVDGEVGGVASCGDTIPHGNYNDTLSKGNCQVKCTITRLD